jgi:hypothetical protein
MCAEAGVGSDDLRKNWCNGCARSAIASPISYLGAGTPRRRSGNHAPHPAQNDYSNLGAPTLASPTWWKPVDNG